MDVSLFEDTLLYLNAFIPRHVHDSMYIISLQQDKCTVLVFELAGKRICISISQILSLSMRLVIQILQKTGENEMIETRMPEAFNYGPEMLENFLKKCPIPLDSVKYPDLFRNQNMLSRNQDHIRKTDILGLKNSKSVEFPTIQEFLLYL